MSHVGKQGNEIRHFLTETAIRLYPTRSLKCKSALSEMTGAEIKFCHPQKYLLRIENT
jgi:hypothetical protein